MKIEVERLSARELEILDLIGEGLSDREISSSLYLSINTIKWHNRQIYAKLGVSSRTQAAALADEKGLLDETPPPSTPPITIRKHNLPAQISSFIGRKTEIDQIKDLLESNRLLTLTGPGGVGKTRLALEVAAELLEAGVFEDGIYLIDLAPVTRPEQVWDTILEGLGLIASAEATTPEILGSFLENKNLLLLFDNCEHLLEFGLLIRELLTKAPALKVLCTSREALNLSGEQIYQVQTLALPDLGSLIPETSILDVESIMLFIKRAQEVGAEIDPDGEDLVTAARICIHLDGLPLAIELAAARMKMFSLDGLLKQMEDCFSILTAGRRDYPERHLTLQRSFDWSYDLLDKDEQTLFNRLAVFQGSCTLDAVEKVCCFDLEVDVLDGIESLLDKNIIQGEQGFDGEPRFVLLKTIHQYAHKRLQETGKLEDIRRRQAEYFTALAEDAKYPLRGGPDQIHWLKRLKADHDNLREVLNWSLEGDGDISIGGRLVSALEIFWPRACCFSESSYWTSRALQLIDQLSPEVQAGVYCSAGLSSYYFNDLSTSKERFKKSLKIYQDLGNRREMGWMYVFMMFSMRMCVEDHQEILTSFERGSGLLREIGDQAGITQALSLLGSHQELMGNLPEAREAIEKSRLISEETGDVFRECFNLINLGYIFLKEGNVISAQECFQDSLRLELSLNWVKVWAAGTFVALAEAALASNNFQRAVILLGAADMLWNRYGLEPWPLIVPDIEEIKVSALTQLSKEDFQATWEEGQSLTSEGAFAYGLEEDYTT